MRVRVCAPACAWTACAHQLSLLKIKPMLPCWDEGHDLKTEDWLSASVLAAAHMHIYVYIHISPNISYTIHRYLLDVCIQYIYIHTYIYIPSEVPSVCAASGF